MLNRNNDHLCLLYLQSNICKRSVVCVQESMWEGTKDCVYLLAKACFFCAYMRMFCLCSFVCLVIHVVPSEVSHRQTDVLHGGGRLRISRGIYCH